MPALRFQVLSDLHLETPLMSPAYLHFSQRENLPIHASNLFLLGDIGLTKHPQLFTFLTSLLSTHADLRIFYVLGNHEPYHTTLEESIARLEEFEEKAGTHRFTFMHRRRVDISESITILGCTLWTKIPDEAAHACATLLKDFDEDKGIWERSVEQHNSDHAQDLAFLNTSVKTISENSPERQIIILTHHSPTFDPRANHPRHDKSSTNDGFRSDLSGEVCWISEKVKMWGFGHTHFSCQFYDTNEAEDGEGKRRKLVVANQKGYGKKDVNVVVVEAGDRADGWRVVMGEKESLDLRGGRREEDGTHGPEEIERKVDTSEQKVGSEADTSENQRSRAFYPEEEGTPATEPSLGTQASKWRTVVGSMKKMTNIS